MWENFDPNALPKGRKPSAARTRLRPVRVDCLEPDLGSAELVLESRLARTWRKSAGVADPDVRYREVAEYDPVLRSHCRIDD